MLLRHGLRAAVLASATTMALPAFAKSATTDSAAPISGPTQPTPGQSAQAPQPTPSQSAQQPSQSAQQPTRPLPPPQQPTQPTPPLQSAPIAQQPAPPTQSPIAQQPTQSPTQPSQSPIAQQPAQSPPVQQPGQSPTQPPQGPITQQPSQSPTQPLPPQRPLPPPAQYPVQQSMPDLLVVKVPFDANGAPSRVGAQILSLNVAFPVTEDGSIDVDQLAGVVAAQEPTALSAALTTASAYASAPELVQLIYQDANNQQRGGSYGSQLWNYWYPLGSNGLYGYGINPYWGATSWNDPNYGYQTYAPTYGYYDASSDSAYPFHYGAYRTNNNFYYFYYWQ